MKMKFLFVALLVILSGTIQAQKKKTQANPTPAQTTPAEQPKEEPKKEEPKATPAASILTQHYARKYAIAVQWSDYDVAKDALYDLIVENPGNDSLITDLAVFYIQNQKYAPGVLVAQELLNRNPKNTAALEIAATGLETLGVLDRALQNYESLYLLTNNVAVLYKMAFLQYQLKRYKESMASVDILMANKESEKMTVSFNDDQNQPKDYPLQVALLNLKGMLMRDQGDKPGAKKQFEQALALAPDFVVAKQNLTELK